MKLFNVTIGATCYVVEADKVEEIESADCYPVKPSELPVVVAPPVVESPQGEQEPQAPLN